MDKIKLNSSEGTLNEAKAKFKNKSGAKMLKKIFFETTGEDKSTCVYTLKSQDHKGFPSLKRLYLEMEDTTEYEFGQKYLFDYSHWLSLTRCTWFRPSVEEWREELRLKLEARYLANLKEIAAKGGKEGLQANKMLLERVRKPKEAVKREKSTGGSGHPWKTSRNASNSEIDEIDNAITSDAFKRLFKATA